MKKEVGFVGSGNLKPEDDEPAPKTIDYQIGDDLVKGQSLNDKNDSVKKDGESCSGCAVTQEDEEIEMTIKWNGNTYVNE